MNDISYMAWYFMACFVVFFGLWAWERSKNRNTRKQARDLDFMWKDRDRLSAQVKVMEEDWDRIEGLEAKLQIAADQAHDARAEIQSLRDEIAEWEENDEYDIEIELDLEDD